MQRCVTSLMLQRIVSLSLNLLCISSALPSVHNLYTYGVSGCAVFAALLH